MRSRTSIGSNIRRIEAVAGDETIRLLRSEQSRLNQAAELLNVPVGSLTDGIEKRLAEMKELQREVAELRRRVAVGRSAELASHATDGAVFARVDGIERNDLKDLALAVRDQPGVEVVVIAGAPAGGGAAVVGAVSADAGIDASALVAPAAKEIQGGGGKGKDFAMAGGRSVEGLDAALDVARAALAGAR